MKVMLYVVLQFFAITIICFASQFLLGLNPIQTLLTFMLIAVVTLTTIVSTEVRTKSSAG